MIVVDIEATGLNWDQHSLLSIGAVDFNDTTRQFYQECRMWEGAKINPEALEVNGFSEEGANDEKKITEAEALEKFLAWAYESTEHTIAGQNVYVDLEFIRAAARRAGRNAAFPHRIIDLHSICFAHMIQRNIDPPVRDGKTDLDSDAIMQYVGIPSEPHPHIAINGAIWEAEAFARILHSTSVFDRFKEYPIPWVEAR